MIIRSIDRKNLEKEIASDEHRLSSIEDEISDLEWEQRSLLDEVYGG
jgi:hypothetical protein